MYRAREVDRLPEETMDLYVRKGASSPEHGSVTLLGDPVVAESVAAAIHAHCRREQRTGWHP